MTVAPAGFHDGELAVQERAGVRAQAARLGPAMLAAPDLTGGLAHFLADRDFAVLTARDGDGRLWTSPLFAAPGFLDPHDGMLEVHAVPVDGDPLHHIDVGQPVGMLAIEFATRRRVRVNGTVAAADANGLVVSVDQAYGNCPRYIQARHLTHAPRRAVSAPRRSTGLSADDVALISRADTFFFGTSHPDRGADASHRGGSPGFVRVDGDTLWWPDYPGNNMFNSLGNVAVDPRAALLFVDFASGATLHLSGTATIEWLTPGVRGDDGATGRRVRFTVDAVVSGPRLDMGSDAPSPSRHNPPPT
jgi:predicted pyridoxine 5'-phosphate oxidase superfamily flavin-nucleotide-binding protein